MKSINMLRTELGHKLLILSCLAALSALPVVLFVLMMGALPLLGGVLSFAVGGPVWCSIGTFFLGPFFLFALWYQAREWVSREHRIVELVGEEHALWVRDAGRPVLGSFLSQGAEYAVWSGWDMSGAWLFEGPVGTTMRQFGINSEPLKKGWASVGSILWSRMIVALHSSLAFRVVRCSSALFVVYMMYRVTRSVITRALWFWFWVFTLGWVTLEMPTHYPVSVIMFVLRTAVKFSNGGLRPFFEWLQWRATLLVTDSLVLVGDVDALIKRKVSKQLAGDTVTFVAHFREFVVQSVSVVADLKLPEYIRSKGWVEPTLETLEASNKLLADIGWPVNVNLNTAPDPVGFKFKEWLLCGTDFATGVHNIKARVDEDLRALFPDASLYKRTETYANVDNELDSLSRYFNKEHYDMPDLELADVWEMVKPIFHESRLTPFNHIIRMWEKKYALGSFMKDPKTGKSKYKRSTFISDIGGYAPFKKLWADTFYWSTQIVPTAHVSVKGESLAPKKWMEDKVRTVIGSPLSQYILSTIWNYGPNHRFSWESTPIKIGMPLNGGTMSQIWANHSRCQIHVEGDFTSFDSTLSGKIHTLVAAVRKKGFEKHSDHQRIADLIDINYAQVNSQLLNTTSTGNIYRKGTGFTTGHSSTSMDNSVALVILYLMAWKEITGLSAREFKFFNELSCFGDDHFLSILGFHPSGWTPSNIRKTMSRWGVENNLVVKPLHECEFLAKFCRRPNAAMRAELDAAGLKDVTMAVWHNKAKLVGKLTAQVKSLNPTYKVERLRSFLGLTAHHKDVYDGIINYFDKVPVMQRVLKSSGRPLPSYTKVLKDWYSRTSEQTREPWFEDEKDEMEHTGKMCHYGEVTAIDSILGTLSIIPDVLNPTIFNYGYHRILQARLRPYLAWAYDLIVLQNGLIETGAVRFSLGKTPYRFLEPDLFATGDSGSNMTEMLVRHWLYMLLVPRLPKIRPPAYVDFVVRKVATLQYIINSKLQSEVATANPFLFQVLAVSALSFVHIPNWMGFLSSVRLPDLNALFQMVSHLFMVTVWSNVPALYQEVERGLKCHTWQKGPVLVEAATGTGKSTDMPLFMANRFGHIYSKIVLIVPRTALAVSLVSYLNTISTIGVSGSCEGLTLDRRAKLWVVTSGAYWGLVGTMPENTLLIFDECHLVEDRHTLTRKLVVKQGVPCIFTSATPTVLNIQECGLHLKLNAANLFSRTDLVHKPVDGKVTLEEVNKRLVPDLLILSRKFRPNNRVLFFVNTKTQAETFSKLAPRRTAVLVSGVPIDTTFKDQWYVSTTVADVGLTIPDLDIVVTPNMTPWGKEKVYKLSTGLYRQRAGRTGRTNNGVVYLVEYDVTLDTMPDDVPMTAPLFSQLFPSGLPPSLVARYWPHETYNALGLHDTSIDLATKNKILATADFMLNTLAPVGQRLREAAIASNSMVGEPHVCEPGTVSAAFSRTHPQDQEEWESTVSQCLEFVLSEACAGASQFAATGAKQPLTNYALPEHLANSSTFSVTGLQKACMSALQLWHDPVSVVKQLSDAIPSHILEEISAAFEISDILRS